MDQPLIPAGIRLRFLGTRGEIELRSRRHHWHTALLVECLQARIMLDCGVDWLHRVADLRPSAIVLTHAHLDHAGGLADGIPCPVYATSVTWSRIDRYPLTDRHLIVTDVPSASALSSGRHSRWNTRFARPLWVID